MLFTALRNMKQSYLSTENINWLHRGLDGMLLRNTLTAVISVATL